MITITAGSYSNVVRVLVPLVITNEQMDEGMDVLESALQMVYEKKGRHRPTRVGCELCDCVVAGDSPARDGQSALGAKSRPGQRPATETVTMIQRD